MVWLQVFALGSMVLTGRAGWSLYQGWTGLTGETMGSLLLQTACWSARIVGGPGVPALCVAGGA